MVPGVGRGVGVVVLGAPVVDGSRCGPGRRQGAAGDAGAEVQGVGEFSFAIQAWPAAGRARWRRVSRLPCIVPVTGFQGSGSRRLLMRCSRVAAVAAAAVELPDGAAPHVLVGLYGQPGSMATGQRRYLGARHRRTADAKIAHMSMATTSTASRQAARRLPAIRGVIGCAALDLAEQAWFRPGQADVPPVRELHRFPGVRVLPPPGPAAAALVNAQVSDRQALAPGSRRPPCNAACAWPPDAGVPGGLGGAIPRSAASAPACSSRRRPQRGGQLRCHGDVFAGKSFPAHFIRRLTRNSLVLPAGPDIARCHRDILVHLFGNSPAARAHRGGWSR